MIEDPQAFVDAHCADYIARYGEEYRGAIVEAIYIASQLKTFNPVNFDFGKCIAAAVFSRMIVPRELWPSQKIIRDAALGGRFR